MVRDTGVQSQVESYQRLKKWYLTQHYKVRIKGKVEQSREWSSALPYSSLWQLLKRKPSGKVANFTYLLWYRVECDTRFVRDENVTV